MKTAWLSSRKPLALLVALGGIFVGALLLWRDVYLFSSLPPPPWIAFAALALAGAILRLVENAEPVSQDPLQCEEGPPIPVPAVGHVYALGARRRYAAIAASLALGCLVIWTLPLLEENESHTLPVVAWLGAIGLLVLAYVPRPRISLGGGLRRRGSGLGSRQFVLVTAITVIGFIVRLVRLGDIPFTLSGDEAAQGMEALRVLSGEMANPFATAWRGVPTMSLQLTALSIRLLGQTVIGLRLPWALVGAATIPLAYWLVTRSFGRTVGLVAASLLTVYHYPIHFSRLGSNQIADALLAVLGLLALTSALKRRQPLSWIAAGGVAGLSLYFYVGARFAPILLVALLAYDFAAGPRRFLSAHAKGMALALVAFLLVGGPMLQLAVRAPQSFQERTNDVGIIQSGWLQQEAVRRHTSMASVLGDQLRRATLAFHYYPDRRGWYDLGQPLLDPFFGSLLAVGLVYATLRLAGRNRDDDVFPYLAWWWGAVLLGGMLTESPPSSQRLTTLSVPVCVFIALALTRLTEAVGRVWRRFPAGAVQVAAVGCFAAISLSTYFQAYTPRRIFGGPYAELATSVAPEISRHRATHFVYLLGAPDVFADFPTFEYLAPGVSIQDVLPPVDGLSSLELSTVQTPALFVLTAQRLSDLDRLEAEFPKGTATPILRPGSNTVIGAIYLTQ